MKDEQVQLYTFILEQLVYDGYQAIAEKLSKTTLIPINPEWAQKQKEKSAEQEEEKKRMLEHAFNVSNKKKRSTKKAKVEKTKKVEKTRLAQLVKSALKLETENSNNNTTFQAVYEESPTVQGLDVDLELQNGIPRKKPALYTTQFITTHKNDVRCAKFSPDGKMVATGSTDTSVKLLNVQQMKKSGKTFDKTEKDFFKPKTFYDHVAAIVGVDFHPSAPILASCGLDSTIRFYDWREETGKRSFKTISESAPVRSLNFHPSGETLLVGTDQNMLRIYDVSTWKPLTPPQMMDHHLGAINEAIYSPEGNFYVSCSTDGTVKLWDSFNNKAVRTLQKPHLGFEVTSVQISKNSKYLLTSGKDGLARIWDLNTGNQIQSVLISHPKGTYARKISWSWNEDYLVVGESNTCLLFDTRTAELSQKLHGHLGAVTFIASSPVEPCLMSCSTDNRGRFWTN